MRKNVGWSILEVAVVSNAVEFELVSRLVVQASDNGSFKPITTGWKLSGMERVAKLERFNETGSVEESGFDVEGGSFDDSAILSWGLDEIFSKFCFWLVVEIGSKRLEK